jgi:hypothetical protein
MNIVHSTLGKRDSQLRWLSVKLISVSPDRPLAQFLHYHYTYRMYFQKADYAIHGSTADSNQRLIVISLVDLALKEHRFILE